MVLNWVCRGDCILWYYMDLQYILYSVLYSWAFRLFPDLHHDGKCPQSYDTNTVRFLHCRVTWLLFLLPPGTAPFSYAIKKMNKFKPGLLKSQKGTPHRGSRALSVPPYHSQQGCWESELLLWAQGSLEAVRLRRRQHLPRRTISAARLTLRSSGWGSFSFCKNLR